MFSSELGNCWTGGRELIVINAKARRRQRRKEKYACLLLVIALILAPSRLCAFASKKMQNEQPARQAIEAVRVVAIAPEP
jgi:hypothetical protein